MTGVQTCALPISAPGSRPIVAYAHSVFATPCALNVPATASARPSSSGMRVPGAVATFSHDMQGAGDLLSSECVNRPQGRRFERLQCSLHDPAGPTVAAALQERSEGRRHIDMIKLGHTRLDQGAQLACALSPHDLLVDINVLLWDSKFF